MSPLYRLEKIISRDMLVVVQHESIVNAVATAYLKQDFPDALMLESERIKNNIMQAVSEIAYQDQLRKFIRKCQHRLITMDGRLLKYTSADRLVGLPSGDLIRPVDILCHFMHQCLGDLLAFIELHFGRYIYWNAWVHRNYVAIARKEMAASLRRTSEVLCQRVDCDTLRNIVAGTFNRFLDETIGQELTYARIRYLRELQRQIVCLSEGQSVGELLLTINFNSRRYFTYWAQRLEQQVALKSTAVEKLSLLANESRRIRQYVFVRKAAYNPKSFPLPEMMTRWISEEVALIERLYSIVSVLPERSSGLEEKAELGISVAVLAAAIRALVGSRAIPDDNITGMGRMLSKCFTTIRSGGSFTVGTFRQSYYEISDGTKRTLIDIFTKAIEWLKKN